MVTTAQIKRKWLAGKSFTNAEHEKLGEITSRMKGTPRQKANKLDKKWKKNEHDIKEFRHRMNKHGLVGARKIYAKEMGTKWANETFNKKIKQIKNDPNLRKRFTKKLLKRRSGELKNWD